MDLRGERSLTPHESILILRSSPYTFTFTFVAFTLSFPLSFGIVIHTLISHPLFLHNHLFSSFTFSELSLLLLHQLTKVLHLFSFSFLPFSIVAFMVTFFCSSNSATLSTLSTSMLIFPRLFKWFLRVSIVYYTSFALPILAVMLIPPNLHSLLYTSILLIIIILFLIIYVSNSALWHLASVISILECDCGLHVMKKGHELLRGMIEMAANVVILYIMACLAIDEALKAAVVKGPGEEGALRVGLLGPDSLVGGAFVGIMMVNLAGLLVQCMIYSACNNYYHGGSEKSLMCDSLDGRLWGYKPLENSIEKGTP